MIHCEGDFLNLARQRAALDERILFKVRNIPGDGFRALAQAAAVESLIEQRASVQALMDAWDAKWNSDRKGGWMPMGSGTRFWPEDPRPRDIDLADIAYGLSRINRFNGRIKPDHYSVAQHSVLVSRILPRRYKLFGLLHDAGEAYLGDVITPIKQLFREFYEPVEDRVMRAAAEAHGFLDVYDSAGAKEEVKRADTILLATEARDVTVLGFVSQRLNELPLDDRITEFWEPRRAEREFLNEWKALKNGAGATV